MIFTLILFLLKIHSSVRSSKDLPYCLWLENKMYPKFTDGIIQEINRKISQTQAIRLCRSTRGVESQIIYVVLHEKCVRLISDMYKDNICVDDKGIKFDATINSLSDFIEQYKVSNKCIAVQLSFPDSMISKLNFTNKELLMEEFKKELRLSLNLKGVLEQFEVYYFPYSIYNYYFYENQPPFDINRRFFTFPLNGAFVSFILNERFYQDLNDFVFRRILNDMIHDKKMKLRDVGLIVSTQIDDGTIFVSILLENISKMTEASLASDIHLNTSVYLILSKLIFSLGVFKEKLLQAISHSRHSEGDRTLAEIFGRFKMLFYRDLDGANPVQRIETLSISDEEFFEELETHFVGLDLEDGKLNQYNTVLVCNLFEIVRLNYELLRNCLFTDSSDEVKILTKSMKEHTEDVIYFYWQCWVENLVEFSNSRNGHNNILDPETPNGADSNYDAANCHLYNDFIDYFFLMYTSNHIVSDVYIEDIRGFLRIIRPNQ